MRTFVFSLSSLLFVHTAHALEPSEIYAKVAPSIVVIVGYSVEKPSASTFGGGVVIAPGEIITNCHVIDNADLIYVK